MKIAKIRNSRSGISVAENKNEEQHSRQSFLYYAPGKDGKVRLESKDLEQHVMDCNRKAQNLYKVITPLEADFSRNKDDKEVFEDLAENFNAAINAALKSARTVKSNSESDLEIELKQRVKKETEFILNLGENKIKMKKQEMQIQEMISELVLRRLKKTLRKEVVIADGRRMQMTEIVNSLMCAICLYGNVESFDPVVLNAFFEKVDSDYMKYKQIKQIVKSIESQSVKVKVTEENGKYLLIPANAEHKKKKYVFEFMKKYAVAEEKEKRELTGHIQELIGLYLCGESGYQKAGNSFADMIENHDCISEEIKEVLDSVETLENLSKQKREEKKEIREELERNKAAGKENKKGGKKEDKKSQNDELRETIKKLDSEIQKLSSEIRTKREELKNTTERVMSVHYRAAVEYLADKVGETILGQIKEKKVCACADLYWIDYIDDTVKKLLVDSKNKGNYRYTTGFLANHIWKEWTQYISGKYIELGKGVYHFAVPDLSGAVDGETVSICEVKPKYRSGISGFDYERIKAEESLEREMEEYILFAVNNFARAVAPEEEREREGHEDVLLMKTLSEIEEGSNTQSENKQDKKNNSKKAIVLYADADRRILQFFGGQSRFRKKEDSLINLYSGEDLYKEIRNELYAIRNVAFHYTTKADKDKVRKHEMAESFFEEELADVSEVFRKKYYSNNVWKFYSTEVINSLMEKIYSGRKYRAAQIPAFNKIISRPALPQIMERFINGTPLKRIKNNPDKNVVIQYWSALFFVLKELYYYDFLQEQENPEDNIKERFFRALERKSGQAEEDKKKAWESFRNRIEEIGKTSSFGEICQGLMVEYMLQNNDSSMVRKKNIYKKTSGRDTQIYKHYRTLLYICIRDAFIEYLKEKWPELRKPILLTKEWSEEEFCRTDGMKHLSLYDHLKEIFYSTVSGPSWYIAAHFINPKYLNHLIGSIRNYLQFTEDIERRAVSLGDSTDIEIAEKNLRYHHTLEVLEFVIQFCGKTTKVMEDYFESNQAYAAYLSDFVDYKTSKHVSDIETALHIFCEQKFKIDGKECMTGIYYDGGNLIPNRNIIRANMYGNVSCLKNSMKKITVAEIRQMYTDKAKLDTVLKEGVCRTRQEQEKLREFQNEKNRIELLDLAIYTEILNDMQAQLIGWSYLRERDLMYYQLGYYYTKLFWTDAIGKEDARRKLVGDEVHIEDGAILYQILAYNSYDLPIISNIGEAAYFMKSEESIGGKAIGAFCKNFINAVSIYLEGLELFENTDEHDNIIKTRNYIEHFKYFIRSDRSMIDLYSEVYDRFFRHDYKLKKSVPTVLINILARNFMDAYIYMELGCKTVGTKKTQEHKATQIAFTDKGIESTALTYTIQPDPISKDNEKKEEKKKEEIPAHSEIFLHQFRSILEYRKGNGNN